MSSSICLITKVLILIFIEAKPNNTLPEDAGNKTTVRPQHVNTKIIHWWKNQPFFRWHDVTSFAFFFFFFSNSSLHLPPAPCRDKQLSQEQQWLRHAGGQYAGWDGLGGNLTRPQRWCERAIRKEAPAQMPLFLSGNFDSSFPLTLDYQPVNGHSDQEGAIPGWFIK